MSVPDQNGSRICAREKFECQITEHRMTFWDLANGRDTDLTPIADPTIGTAVATSAAGIAAGAALVGYAFALAFHVAGPGGPLPPLIVGRNMIRSSFGALDDARSERQRAIDQVPKQRIAQAIRYYKRALAIEPGSPTILYRLSISLAADGNLSAALGSIDQAIHIWPTNHTYWLQKGTLGIAAGDLNTALDAFGKASELCPDDPECWSNLGLVCRQLGDHERSEHCWQKVVDLSPTSASAWINRAELAYLLDHVSEGVKAWECACKLDPTLIPKWVAVCEVGNRAFSNGDIESAVTRYEEAIYFNPEYDRPWIGKALCEKRRGQYDLALQFLDKALELESRSAMTWFNKGNLLSTMGREGDANVSWHEAFRLDASTRVPWVVELQEGVRLLGEGQPLAALEHLNKAIQLFNSFAEAWFRAGVAHRALGHADDARRCWERTVEILPEHGHAWLNLANLELDSGNRNKALEGWSRSLACSPELGQAALNKGAALADAGDLKGAADLFSKAAQLGHPFGERALQLCRLYDEMNPSVGPYV